METAANANPITIETDLPCAICGYNLRGLASDANCPECGQAVARTFMPDLQRSDPAWLRHQANTMLLLGALCLVNIQPDRYRLGWVVVSNVLSLATVAAMVWACWRLATPEPPGPPTDGEATRQRALRAAPIVYGAVVLGGVFSNAFNRTALGIASIVAIVALIAANGLVAYFLYRLARRTNDRLLTLHARVVLWSFPVSQASNVLFSFAPLFINSHSDVSGQFIFTLLGVVNWILGVSVYLALLLMGRMHEALRAAARVAEDQSPPVPPS
jgi:hypothetical protein